MATGRSPGRRDRAGRRVGQRLGVELDEGEAAEWVAAMEAEATGGDIVVDVDTGVYGHRVTMLDFAPADLARFRGSPRSSASRTGRRRSRRRWRCPGRRRRARSSAYPGDCDFFERVHIRAADAATRRAAILARRHAREGALDARRADATGCGRSSSGRYPFDVDHATASRSAPARRSRGRRPRSRPAR